MAENIFKEYSSNEKNPDWEKHIERENQLYQRKNDIRSEYERDYTRILHSLAYRRLKHKTQVFFNIENDHVCTRMEHVQHVESVSCTIAKYLGLNVDLTRAIAMGHDLGHAPFGHEGEVELTNIRNEIGLDKFWHERNSLRMIDNIELLEDNNSNLQNLNLTYAVRDGILGHCGEPAIEGQKPRDEIIDLKDFTHSNKFQPYTWEGCVVKIADNISYLGRDLEDAKEMKLLTERDLNNFDKSIEEIKLNNSSIIGYLTEDLCRNSSVEQGLKFSKEAHQIMERIKCFNSEKIYKNEKIQPTIRYFKVVMNEIFHLLKNEYNGTATTKNIRKLKRYYPSLAEEFSGWLETYSNSVDRDNESYFNKVIYDLNDEKQYSKAIVDYMSGMTDQYIIRVYNEIVSF